MRKKEEAAVLGELLAWYAEMGATDAVAERATAWTGRGNSPPGEQSQPPAPRPAAVPPLPPDRPPPPAAFAAAERGPPAATALRRFPAAVPDGAVMAARAAAGEAASLEELTDALARFEGCSLKATAKSLCFYRGPPRARLMLIGEAPGREEDLAGRPFVGPAGRLLDRMLAAIGLDEQQVHITNIVYWRPPGNRTPTPQEAQVCRPFLEQQVKLVAPELIVLLGGAAAKHLLEVTDGIMRVRGKLATVALGGRQIRALPTLHPAYLLRTPGAKRLAWRDLLAIRAALSP
jgi:DNA polymerase